MYLNHWIGAFAAHAIFVRFGMRDSLMAQISSVIIALLVAAALYLAIDKNVRVRRDHFFKEKRGKIAASIGFILVACGLVYGLSR